ncbi:MAG: carbamoyltransferase HypF [Bacteroidales bacterium]|nr:carbamoyltransferase HypF [Bacteroidales bacterium]
MKDPVARLIRIEGLVQGVGFRPFVYRLAGNLNISGWVMNRNDAVMIRVEGSADAVPVFIERLKEQAPAASQIDIINIENVFPEYLKDFRILDSQDLSDETSEISPDIAVCNDCLEDMKYQPHRLNYPFINCTNCGPRFSIIRDFPYDREKTTMSTFKMCAQCASEYSTITDRRFHAQPIACNTCGPWYTLHISNQMKNNFTEILRIIVQLIAEGKIIAVKGIGGFHLMCDALNPDAVKRLRKVKKREGKPFAVMFRDLKAIHEYAEVPEEEAALLVSWKRPIVLLQSKNKLTDGICLGLNTLGAFLPYMPFHYLLFDKLKTGALVLTSGNFAEEPIVIDNDHAIEAFKTVADAILTYNRDIFNRTDDSVVRLISGKERVMRRSRGYAPSPVRLPFDVDGILATGAELANCFCIGKGKQAVLSQHIGDLKNAETLAFYTESTERFLKLYRLKPSLVAADMHPDYLSTRYARGLGIKIVEVQHHHAHIAAGMAEHGIDEPVIGVCFDGSGYGPDGNTWGGEFLITTLDGFRRYAHFDTIPLPGGDVATREPWRTGLSLLYMAYGKELTELEIPFIRNLDKKIMALVTEALEKKINTPLSSGCGRLFDGVAAITGLCTKSLFHAEAPMRLEAAIAPGLTDRYNVDINATISFTKTIQQITSDLLNHVHVSVIAARFHNTIIWSIFETASKIRNETGITKVVLSGGSFQNKYMAEQAIALLTGNDFDVYMAGKVPVNDGGIALGQLVIAARKRDKKEI